MSDVSPAIECRGLEVSVGAKRLLGPIDLVIQPEEHVLVVGPSGSGKSTLLRAVAGLVEPTAGEIHLFGEPASGLGRVMVEPQDRGVGFLFQGGALWPHLSVLGTLEFVLKMRGVEKARRRARAQELLELVDLVGYDDQRAPTLSGGEAQRLGLARALATEPRILLLDEPLGPLDAPRRGALLDMLHGLQQRLGLTTLHVTHDPAEADRIASRTIEIEAGGLLAAGA